MLKYICYYVLLLFTFLDKDASLRGKILKGKTKVDYGTILFTEDMDIKKVLHSGERCVHLLEIPKQEYGRIYDRGVIELTDTLCDNNVIYGKKLMDSDEKK